MQEARQTVIFSKPKLKHGFSNQQILVEGTAKVTMADFWITQGWYRTMNDGSKKLISAKWKKSPGVRKAAVIFLVEKVLKKDPRDLTIEDFRLNNLNGLFMTYFSCSPYKAMTEAGYIFHPWEMVVTPRSLFESKEHRIAAVKWLVDKVGKDPREINYSDFFSNRLYGLFTTNYNHSPYAALKEAGYIFHPWEMVVTPRSFSESKESRIARIKEFVDNLGKNPRDITAKDFHLNHMVSFLKYNYGCSPYKAIIEAGYIFNPWEMNYTPRGFYKIKENRIEVIKWLVDILGKDPRKIKYTDFYANRLRGLLSIYYHGNVYIALEEAGFVTIKDKASMYRNRSDSK